MPILQITIASALAWLLGYSTPHLNRANFGHILYVRFPRMYVRWCDASWCS